MLDNPIRQCPFESDIMSGLFRLNPFVLKNFLALGLELAIKRGILQQIVRHRRLFDFVRHSRESQDSLATDNLCGNHLADNPYFYLQRCEMVS